MAQKEGLRLPVEKSTCEEAEAGLDSLMVQSWDRESDFVQTLNCSPLWTAAFMLAFDQYFPEQSLHLSGKTTRWIGRVVSWLHLVLAMNIFGDLRPWTRTKFSEGYSHSKCSRNTMSKNGQLFSGVITYFYIKVNSVKYEGLIVYFKRLVHFNSRLRSPRIAGQPTVGFSVRWILEVAVLPLWEPTDIEQIG